VSPNTSLSRISPLAECARYFNMSMCFVDPTLRTDGYDLNHCRAMHAPSGHRRRCWREFDVDRCVDTARRHLIGVGTMTPLSRNAAHVASCMAQTMGGHAREKIAKPFSIQAMVMEWTKSTRTFCFQAILGQYTQSRVRCSRMNENKEMDQELGRSRPKHHLPNRINHRMHYNRGSRCSTRILRRLHRVFKPRGATSDSVFVAVSLRDASARA